jgi:hypothetical protein
MMPPVSTVGTALGRDLSVSQVCGKWLDWTTNNVLKKVLAYILLKKIVYKNLLEKICKNFFV